MDKFKTAAGVAFVTVFWCILDFVISLVANNWGDPKRVAMVVLLLIVSVLGIIFIALKKPVVSVVLFAVGMVAAVLQGIFMNLGFIFIFLNVGVLALIIAIVLLILGIRENKGKDGE
mgnify:CR=1 FL=1